MDKHDRARCSVEYGTEYPYDGKHDADWTHRAARGVLYDLCDRRGIKHAFSDVDADVREEMVASLALIIAAAQGRDTRAHERFENAPVGTVLQGDGMLIFKAGEIRPADTQTIERIHDILENPD